MVAVRYKFHQADVRYEIPTAEKLLYVVNDNKEIRNYFKAEFWRLLNHAHCDKSEIESETKLVT